MIDFDGQIMGNDDSQQNPKLKLGMMTGIHGRNHELSIKIIQNSTTFEEIFFEILIPFTK